MSDFLGRLAGRALGTVPMVRPRVASRFAPDPATPPLGEAPLAHSDEGAFGRAVAGEVDPVREVRDPPRGPRSRPSDVEQDEPRARRVHAPEGAATPRAEGPRATLVEGASAAPPAPLMRVEADRSEARWAAPGPPAGTPEEPGDEVDPPVHETAERGARVDDGERAAARAPASASPRALADTSRGIGAAARGAPATQVSNEGRRADTWREPAGAPVTRAGPALVSEGEDDDALLVPSARRAIEAPPAPDAAIEPRAGAPVTSPRAPSAEPTAPPATPTIQVRIGRIEVRAAPQAPARPAEPRRPEPLGLQDFLAGRGARR